MEQNIAMSVQIQRTPESCLKIKVFTSSKEIIQSKPFRTVTALAMWAHKHVPEEELKAINYYDQHLLSQIAEEGADWLEILIEETFQKKLYEIVEN